MIRKFLFVAGVIFLTSCGGGDSKPAEKKDEPAAGSTTDLSQNPDYQKGLALIGKSDCLTCHSVADKINGPSYQEIATQYAGRPDTIVGYLAKKIIEGGSGVWGEIPMTPHADLAREDAEAMAKYVLLLKK